MIQFFKGVSEKPFGNIHSMPHPRSFLSLLRLLSVKGHFISVPLLGLTVVLVLKGIFMKNLSGFLSVMKVTKLMFSISGHAFLSGKLRMY